MIGSKPMFVAAFSFCTATGLMVLLCANAHIDIFPCKVTTRDRSGTNSWGGTAPLVTRDGTCSLMAHLRDAQHDPSEKSELTGAGWALLFGFCVGIGAANAAINYTFISKVIAKKRLRSNQNDA